VFAAEIDVGKRMRRVATWAAFRLKEAASKDKDKISANRD
jgi:hypothetical protein